MRINNLISSLALTLPLLANPSAVTATPVAAEVEVAVSVRVGPPLLPVYVQPQCPGTGYIWEPGYWAYGDDGYYWVPGVWILPPAVGLLWTPGYWGFADGLYVWHGGYWGPVVGFYGGINYGFGYPGTGFYGGYWRGTTYFYNTRVVNVNNAIVHNVYNGTVVNEGRSVNRVSYNGGPGGLQARPTSAELAAAHQRHTLMTSEQKQHQQISSADRTMLASVNHGRPDVAVAPRRQPLSNASAAPNNKPGAEERPPAATRPNEAGPASSPSRSAPYHPPKSNEPAHPNRAPKATPERTPSHPSTPTPRPAPSHLNKAPAPKPITPHAEKPITHQPALKPGAPSAHPSTHPSTSHPAASHPSSHPSQPHTSAPQASKPGVPSNAHPQATTRELP